MQIATLILLVVFVVSVVALAMYRIHDNITFTLSLCVLLIVLIWATRIDISKFARRIGINMSLAETFTVAPANNKNTKENNKQTTDEEAPPKLDGRAYADLIGLPKRVKNILEPHFENLIKAASGVTEEESEKEETFEMSAAYYIDKPDATLYTNGSVDMDKYNVVEKQYRAINRVLDLLRAKRPFAYQKLMRLA